MRALQQAGTTRKMPGSLSDPLVSEILASLQQQLGGHANCLCLRRGAFRSCADLRVAADFSLSPLSLLPFSVLSFLRKRRLFTACLPFPHPLTLPTLLPTAMPLHLHLALPLRLLLQAPLPARRARQLRRVLERGFFARSGWAVLKGRTMSTAMACHCT